MHTSNISRFFTLFHIRITRHHLTPLPACLLTCDAMQCRYMGRTQQGAAKGVVPLLFISFPSAKDPLWAEKHPGKSTATIVTFANYDWFKEVCFRRMLSVFLSSAHRLSIICLSATPPCLCLVDVCLSLAYCLTSCFCCSANLPKSGVSMQHNAC